MGGLELDGPKFLLFDELKQGQPLLVHRAHLKILAIEAEFVKFQIKKNLIFKNYGI